MSDSLQQILTDLRESKRDYLPWRRPSAVADLSTESIKVLFPGAFNPLHHGHLQMASIATQRSAAPIWFELCVNNIEKGAIGAPQLAQRLQQDFLDHGLLISSATKFIDKAKLFPEVMFVVGADTLERIDAIRFYENRVARDTAIERLHDAGCRFLVFGRSYTLFESPAQDKRRVAEPPAQFHGADLKLSPRLRQLCEFVSRREFDEPISSTEIRRFQGNEPSA